MSIFFTVLAGRHEDFDGETIENIKFCADAGSMEEAQLLIQENKLYTYPICRIEVSGFEAA